MTLRGAQSASPQATSSKIPGKGDPDPAGMREAPDHVGVDVNKLSLLQTPVMTDCEPGGIDRADEMIYRHGGNDESRVIESIVAVDMYQTILLANHGALPAPVEARAGVVHFLGLAVAKRRLIEVVHSLVISDVGKKLIVLSGDARV